jgi:hypothetical protein
MENICELQMAVEMQQPSNGGLGVIHTLSSVNGSSDDQSNIDSFPGSLLIIFVVTTMYVMYLEISGIRDLAKYLATGSTLTFHQGMIPIRFALPWATLFRSLFIVRKLINSHEFTSNARNLSIVLAVGIFFGYMLLEL